MPVMKRAILTLIVAGGAACGEPDITEGCFESDLGMWCGNFDTIPAEGCGVPKGDLTYRCGEFDVIADRSAGQSGVAHYFDQTTGEHVATRYWQDTNGSCGGFESWYGRRVECDASCVYPSGEGQYDLPSCD